MEGNDERPRDDVPTLVSALRTPYGRIIIIVTGDIDLSTRDQLREVIAAYDEDITIDLSGVGLLDSSGIGVLVVERTRLDRAGGSLTLHDPQPNVRRALEDTGLGTWIVP